MIKENAHLTSILGIMFYLAAIIALLQNRESLTAIQIVTACGVYIFLNTLYSSYKHQLTATRFIEFGLIALLVAVFALSYLT